MDINDTKVNAINFFGLSRQYLKTSIYFPWIPFISFKLPVSNSLRLLCCSLSKFLSVPKTLPITGIKKREKITIEIDRFKAINESIKFAKKEDIVLIAGKGHEDYQILNDKVIDFDDRKIAQKLLQEKSKSL